MNVYPLFPSVVGASVLDSRVDKYHDVLKSEEFTSDSRRYAAPDSNPSISRKVLDKHLELKNIILQEFKKFKNETLKLSTTDFKITTSWMTKTTPGGYCHYHNHKNCYYSGVMYLDNHESGDLVFKNVLTNLHSICVNPADEWTQETYQTFYIRPQKNLVVFFPSYIEHKIDLYTGKPTRYSLAFNFHPTGKFGEADSYIEMDVSKKRM